MCRTCKGSGSLVTFGGRRIEHWSCPACGGAGVRVVYSHPFVNNRLRAQEQAS